MITKYLQEYEVGEKWVSRGRTITEADVVNFAGVTGDWFPLHVDREYAAGTSFGQRIAHGMLVLSAASGLIDISPEVFIAFYGMEKVRFTGPTFIDDTIHVELEVTEIQEKGDDRGVITAEQKIVKQTGEPVAVATLKIAMHMSAEREEASLQ